MDDDSQKIAIDVCLRALRAFSTQLTQDPKLAEISEDDLIFALGAAMANHIAAKGMTKVHERLNLFLEAFSSYARHLSQNENEVQNAFSFLTPSALAN